MDEKFWQRFKAVDAQRYIFGTTTEAQALIEIFKNKNIAIEAVIDNFYRFDSFHGLPCIKLIDVPDNAVVVSAVTNSRPLDVNQLLKSKGLTYCDYFSFYRNSGFICPKIDFWEGANSHWESNKEDYEEVKSWLADDESKHTFDAVVGFRNNYDLAFMDGFKFDITNMYIEPFILPFKDSAIFFDLGAYDGSDSERFLRHVNKGIAYLFEPIPEQVNVLQKKYQNSNSVQVVAAAVGSTEKTVYFNVSGTSSKVVESGDDQDAVAVQQTYLDKFCKQNELQPDYIKMDVEGFEVEVLKGMEELIQQHKPKLAVSVYHRVEHLTQVPMMLKALCPEYKFYLRHYTQGYSETVLFAI
ncbi:FkbM family methyltransferase [Pseudoalteromonas sp. JBTF-M23]|uniref:FkbM family methyltransferase n=1 Tax=Pseudoalteromonas caenipelagi TaxID=2726988 RepID=A0A849VDA2_9GAMM|nr:FkbM family methyltransferase [Pseudoalteromonas caenipelagi]NOU50788.1 FkbM family methyltransferase [Pseudoalteromonas caenipelagi]